MSKPIPAIEIIIKPEFEAHECDTEGSPDIDICMSCKDHASFCSDCGESDCCGSRAYMPD